MTATALINVMDLDAMMVEDAISSPEFDEIGTSTYADGNRVTDVTFALGAGRYAIATHDDMATWDHALGRLDSLAPGTGEWVVTDSAHSSSILVSYLTRAA